MPKSLLTSITPIAAELNIMRIISGADPSRVFDDFFQLDRIVRYKAMPALD
jgi:hypothetical protein